MIQPIQLVVDHAVRFLCAKPYPGHPKGCPNYGKKDTCPPRAPFIRDLIDLERPVYAIWTVFDLGQHVERMRALHPSWSDRQLTCCLYWQPAARKRLEKEIKSFPIICPVHLFIRIPEACGVNVTATMKSIGVELEWPPVTKTYQVAIAGRPK